MSLTPPDLTEWVTRLQQQASTLREVGLVADVPSAWDRLRTTPSAFVLPVSERPRSQGGASEHRILQLVEFRVGLLVAVSNARDTRGGAAQTQLGEVLALIRPVLLGWRPSGAEHIVTFSGARIMRYDQRALWWQDTYQTSYRMTIGEQP